MQTSAPPDNVRSNTQPNVSGPSNKGPLTLSPWILVPDCRLITVEHPAIIRNIDKGLETLGGEKALVKLAATNGASGLQLHFRPDDLMQPTIPSRTVPTNNLLVRVRIPKKKRSQSGGIATSSDGDGKNEKTLLERLRESDGKYKIEAIGMIEQTVRFREMANFQYNHRDNPHVKKMRETLFKGTYEDIKNFTISDERGISKAESVPPPFMSTTPIPHAYYYRQNPAVKKLLINGKTKLLNYQAGPKTLTPMMHNTSEHIPTPPADLPAYESLDGPTKECVDLLRELFQQRPIWTRRALYNNFPRQLQPLVRFSMVHVGYMWRAGPWRDTCVRYGIDPRSDPKYRFYQCISFQMDPNARLPGPTSAPNSHIFDGKRIVKDGRCFQLCDITDPVVRRLIETEHIRKACDVNNDGWYRTCTMLKIKAVMRTKIQNIHEGTTHPDPEFQDVIDNIESEDEDQEAERRERERKEKELRGHKRRGVVQTGRSAVYQVKTKGPPGRKRAESITTRGKENATVVGQSKNQRNVDAGVVEAEIETQRERPQDADADAGEEDEWDQELEVPSMPGMTQDRIEDIMTMEDDGMGFDDGEDSEVLGEDEEDEIDDQFVAVG